MIRGSFSSARVSLSKSDKIHTVNHRNACGAHQSYRRFCLCASYFTRHPLDWERNNSSKIRVCTLKAAIKYDPPSSVSQVRWSERMKRIHKLITIALCLL